jgi:dihydrofolate synthase/folylpolyglutamate synthase
MSYSEAIDYLFGLQKHGIKLGLEKTRKILSLTGDPQTQFKCIHIAGTNGKGSVSAMIASILNNCGYRVGLFTSPHMVSFTERIRIDGADITEDEVAALTDEVRAKIGTREDELSPTFFEVVTAMAFTYFAKQKVEWAVLETGMGGRLDATNVVVPAVSVITRISYDHKDFLGESIRQIAGEKAGIIKDGIPVVSAGQMPEVLDVIREAARQKNASLFVCGDDFSVSMNSTGIGGTSFRYSNGCVEMNKLFTPLAGEHQAVNAALAVKAVSIALKRTAITGDAGAGLCAGPVREPINMEAIRKGLAATRWRGRLELVSSDPRIIIDGAHNADAATALAAFITKYLGGHKIILVLGIMADKDVGDILRALLPVANETIFTTPAYSRAESPGKLAELAKNAGFADVFVSSTVKDALALSMERYSMLSNDTPAAIIITGSFYTAGEAMEAMGEKAVLGTLREAR